MDHLHVNNEIAPIKTVLVHRPGDETQNYPDSDFDQVFSLRKWTSRFDLDRAQAEHDFMTDLFKRNGIKVIELRDLVASSLQAEDEARNKIIGSYLLQCGATGSEFLSAVREHLAQAHNDDQLTDMLFNGVRFGETELCQEKDRSLTALTDETFDPSSLLVNPLATSFFTRDPAAIVGGGVVFNHMYWPERDREVALYQLIFHHHPTLKTNALCDLNHSSYHIEGGDILNLDRNTIIAGISDRTETPAIEALAQKLLLSTSFDTKRIIVMSVPSDGVRIHLDTFISRVDYDAFVVDKDICENSAFYLIRPQSGRNSLLTTSLDMSLQDILAKYTGGPVRLIACGGGRETAYERERHNNATSVLALAPGKLCVYEENVWTNEALDRAGMELNVLSLDELTQGYGGPNCLCLPLYREDL